MTEPYQLTASQALSLMKSGELTVTAYATSLINRVQARDSHTKAWAYFDPPTILAAAAHLDSIHPSSRGPLHGIPIAVKDVIQTKDMPTVYNSDIYRSKSTPDTSSPTEANAISDPNLKVDAAPIITLRALGALVFGKTTTTEFAATTVGGPSCNPHDGERTPGGSSSGSGAAVGDYQCPVGLGTQTGGSTIRPGSFNGIYAFKPTWGAISREGLAQYSMTCDTLGLYARSVDDLQLLSAGFQLADDEPIPSTPFQISGAKIAFCKTHVWPKAGPGTRNAWEKAKGLLEKKGAVVEEIELPGDFEKITAWHANVLAGEGRTSFLGNYLLAKEKMDTMLHGHVENTTKLTRKAQLESYDGCARLRPVWDEIASKYDAVFTPSVVDEAPLGISSTGDASFCSMWTILQVPCLNVPGFAGENGLPIGLTLVGPRYRDLHVLYAGKAIGEVFESEGGFKHKLF